MKKLLSYFFKPRTGAKDIPPVGAHLDKFKDDLHEHLSKVETKTFIYDYQQAIGQLYTMDKIDFKSAFEEKNKEEADKVRDMQEKAKQSEMKINSSFFNDYSLEILNSTSNNDLVDLACKSFVGSTGSEINFTN
jgi:hypothetical protein